ncbi:MULTISPECIES: ATP-dependent Clp protease proteolytic subunit [Streptomyces]|uniref:ATP-dependent Clp protease proteolytic subunit n=2 Tax=Streptomyces TaxID=1883 RepID=A0A3R7IPW9_9ACTN|nr:MULTISPECIES: ATP-dependent Clp protease proteolytic subunit [Streptomyces]KNE79601.1 Clp protease ClpP [Streptomyces fradiae]OFA54776.1 ATP-dependent Clp protease proteolytic subunit [Streptomyces fradiae]PQM21233.1 ATP-dependent Clp protease proteolytic subunit [Streptomyces xinghaiensis]RKM93601.1 ATP-dependent Clp protease proteolytic subunit [Streptomyces xinghaiensis]RNC71596.1 ATP-dependent Clp protease proteolytic subunit [Streptomyces xinghaiensis]
MESPTARYVLPQFTERTSRGIRTLDPYSRLLEERIVFLGTEVDETSANDVIAQLMHLEHAAPGRGISLYINSPGGSLTAMTAIYDTMLFVGCPIETICLGQAAEEAAVLLAAGEPGRRLMLPGSRAVLRQPSLAEPVQGQVDDLEIRAREVARARVMLEEMLVRHTGQSAERVASDIERDRILTAGEAVAYGLADRIVANRKGSAAPVGRG